MSGFLERLGMNFGGGNNGSQPVQGGQGGNSDPNNNGNFTGMNGGNPAVDGNGQQGAGAQGEQKDQYADLFNDLPEPTTPKPIFDPVDPKQLKEFASKQNFLQGVDRNLLGKVEQGGAEGTRAMLQIIQQVASNAYAASTQSSLSLIEDGTKRSADALRGELPTHLRTEASRNALNQELMKDPAVAPVVESIRGVIAQKYPDKHPSEIARMTEGYFEMLSGKFGGAAGNGGSTSGKGEDTTQDIDWEQFYRN